MTGEHTNHNAQLIPVVNGASLRYVRHMVGRDGLYQVQSRLHVSKVDRCRPFGVSDISTVPELGSVPSPYELWPESYRTITPPLYYILIVAWGMLISIHVEGRYISAPKSQEPCRAYAQNHAFGCTSPIPSEAELPRPGSRPSGSSYGCWALLPVSARF